jgi:hypothetical protein
VWRQYGPPREPARRLDQERRSAAQRPVRRIQAGACHRPELRDRLRHVPLENRMYPHCLSPTEGAMASDARPGPS